MLPLRTLFACIDRGTVTDGEQMLMMVFASILFTFGNAQTREIEDAILPKPCCTLFACTDRGSVADGVRLDLRTGIRNIQCMLPPRALFACTDRGI